MDYSINTKPLLNITDSEFEDDLGTDLENSIVNVPDGKPFFKPHEPRDKYVILPHVYLLDGSFSYSSCVLFPDLSLHILFFIYLE